MAIFGITLPRAFVDGTNAPASGARFEVYDSGTTTPKTVYSTPTLSVSLGSSVTADANGVAVPNIVYMDGPAGLKLDVKWQASGTIDTNSPSLAGYPIDNFNGYPYQGLGADSVPFTATTRIPETTVQAAIEGRDYALELVEVRDDLVDATGSSNAYAFTTGLSTYTAYATGDVFQFKANHTNTTSATLEVNGLGAKTLRYYDTLNSKQTFVSGQIQSGHILKVQYDGTDFVVIDHKYPLAVAAQAQAGTAQGLVMDPALTRAAVDARAMRFVEGGLTDVSTGSPTSAAFTGLPDDIVKIVVHFDNVSWSGTDSLHAELGDSGGYETSGYNSSVYSGASVYLTTAAKLTNGATPSGVYSGHLLLERADEASNLWTYSGHIGSTAAGFNLAFGSKALSARLDRIRINFSGSDTFDAGSVAMTYVVSAST